MKVTKQEQWIYDKAAAAEASADAGIAINLTVYIIGAIALMVAGFTINDKLDHIPKSCPSITYYTSTSEFSN